MAKELMHNLILLVGRSEAATKEAADALAEQIISIARSIISSES